MAQRLPYEPLNGREREILMLLAQNLSDREIADRLVLSLHTVKWYNRTIFDKLDVRNRRQAIQQAMEMGLLDAPVLPVPPNTEPKHNLPAALTPFIGRSEERDDLCRMLTHPHTRLVTLLAPGGMGKTRLALEAAESLLGQYPDGVWFAALAGLTVPDQLVSAVAEALGFQFMPDGRTAWQQLSDFLRRKHLLLLLDNFEHLLDAAPLVSKVLAAAPGVKFLVTSREKLSLTGEVVYALTGLHYPAEGTDEPLRYAAVQLFVECALRANPRFKPNGAESIARVCRAAQGMPLAIELAAAWVGTLAVREIADEISRSADFLHTKAQDVPVRLRSVRAVFEAAWARLDDPSRRAFRWLSVFRGGCTREAAQKITGASVATLAALADKALLWRNPHTERYEVHELLRQYAEEQLEQSGEGEAARLAHQEYYAALAGTWGAAIWRGKQREAYAVLDADIDNIRQALAHATVRGIAKELEPYSDLIWYYDRCGWWTELLALFKAAGERLEPHDSVALAKMLKGQVIALFRLNINPKEAYELSLRSLEMIRRLGALEALPRALLDHDIGLCAVGRMEDGVRLLMDAEPLFEELNNPPDIATIHHHLCDSAMLMNDLETAETRGREALRLFTQAGNYWGMCHSLSALGRVAYRSGDYGLAEQRFTQELSFARMINFHLGIDWSTFDLALLARVKGDWHDTRRQFLEVLRRRRRIGRPDNAIFTVLMFLAEASVMLGEPEEALHCLRESVGLIDDRVEEREFGLWLMVAASHLALREEFKSAAVFYGVLEARGGKGRFNLSLEWQTYDNIAAQCRAALTPEEFDAAAARGQTLTVEAAIAELTPVL